MPYAYRSERVVGRMRTVDLLDFDEVEILAAGDLHIGDSHCDMDMVREGLADWLKEKPHRRAVIAGDVFNMALRGSVSDNDEMSVKEARRLLARILEPVKHQIIAVVPGNHDSRQTGAKVGGDDSVDALCAQLGIPYFDDGEAVLNLRVGQWAHQPKAKTSPVSYVLFMAHGYSGGRTAGGKTNGLLSLGQIVRNCDLYLNGHGHDPIVKPEVSWHADTRTGNLIEQNVLYVSCGASLKRGGYPVAKSYKPLARIWPVVKLSGKCKRMTAIVNH